MKRKIFVFNNGGSAGWYSAQAISDEGLFLAGHTCSHETWMPHDMGVTSDWKHDIYNEYAPDGWEIEFVPHSEVPNHAGLQEAFKKLDLLEKAGLPTQFEKYAGTEIEVVVTTE